MREPLVFDAAVTDDERSWLRSADDLSFVEATAVGHALNFGVEPDEMAT